MSGQFICVPVLTPFGATHLGGILSLFSRILFWNFSLANEKSSNINSVQENDLRLKYSKVTTRIKIRIWIAKFNLT